MEDCATVSSFTGKSSASIRELSQVIGCLPSTAIAVLPAHMQYRAMQRQQILELQETGDYNSKITLSTERKAELDRWVQNIHLSKERSITSASPQLIIASDTSLKRWGAFCQGHKTGGSWTLLKSKYYTNVLELKAAKFAILTIHQFNPHILKWTMHLPFIFSKDVGIPTTKFSHI